MLIKLRFAAGTASATIYANITGGVIESTTQSAIYLSNLRAILTVGNNEGAVSKETPVLKGAIYGIENNGGTFNFYDGIIQGATQAIYGEVTDMPESYKVVTESNDTIAYLDIVSETEKAVTVNGVNYLSFFENGKTYGGGICKIEGSSVVISK